MNYVDDLVKKDYEKFTKQNFKKNKELTVEKICNGYVLPVNKSFNPYKTLCGTGGVLDSNKEYIENSAMKGYKMADRLYGKYEFDDKEIPYIDEKVIYLNHFIHQWGHYLIDVINRLWYILKNDISEYKIVYTTRIGKEDFIKGNYLEILKLLGIEEEKLININKVTKFKEIIIPESSIYPGKYFTQEYVKIFDTIVKNSEININEQGKKIYCSRKQFKRANKKEIGEENLEKIFNDNGYESVFFEKMNVKEQISIINNSKEIVAISGTLPHNLLFARNYPHVTILNKTYKLNIHQFLINQISNSKVDFVDVNISPMPILYGKGPFIIKITENFKKYCLNNNIECKNKVNYKISLKEKIWYYFIYLISYRGKIIEDENVETKDIRTLYKKRQN